MIATPKRHTRAEKRLILAICLQKECFEHFDAGFPGGFRRVLMGVGRARSGRFVPCREGEEDVGPHGARQEGDALFAPRRFRGDNFKRNPIGEEIEFEFFFIARKKQFGDVRCRGGAREDRSRQKRMPVGQFFHYKEGCKALFPQVAGMRVGREKREPTADFFFDKARVGRGAEGGADGLQSLFAIHAVAGRQAGDGGRRFAIKFRLFNHRDLRDGVESDTEC